MAWRLVEDDGATAALGLATDECLARRAGTAESPPTLRLYTYRPHCALVGRFQSVPHEVRAAFCQAHDVEINRRPTGGGAILMGPDQLGIALALRGRGDGLPGQARALMERFSHGIVRGLGFLGVTASFRGKNDLAVGGRKIAGLGVHREPSGGLLFHASLLVDLDVALMARVLRLPALSGDEPNPTQLAVLATRTITLRDCLARPIGMAEVRGQVAAGFAGAFEVELVASELAADELAAAAALEAEKYALAGWVHQETAVKDATGVASQRTPAGTVEARVALAGGTIKSAAIRGDFFESDAAIADLEARLRWRPAATAAAIVAEWARGAPVETVPVAAFVRVVEAAVRNASPEPYGCFVSPEAGHA
jgi:lipoate-protein ligase A